jgi:hypothetical protein
MIPGNAMTEEKTGGQISKGVRKSGGEILDF